MKEDLHSGWPQPEVLALSPRFIWGYHHHPQHRQESSPRGNLRQFVIEICRTYPRNIWMNKSNEAIWSNESDFHTTRKVSDLFLTPKIATSVANRPWQLKILIKNLDHQLMLLTKKDSHWPFLLIMDTVLLHILDKSGHGGKLRKLTQRFPPFILKH